MESVIDYGEVGMFNQVLNPLAKAVLRYMRKLNNLNVDRVKLV